MIGNRTDGDEGVRNQALVPIHNMKEIEERILFNVIEYLGRRAEKLGNIRIFLYLGYEYRKKVTFFTRSSVWTMSRKEQGA
jgi:hypothetical protein